VIAATDPKTGYLRLCALRARQCVRPRRVRRPRACEDVSHVSLDRLRPEEERFGNLRICSAIHDEPRDLELALRQCFDAGPIERAGAGAAVDSMAEASQFALGGGAISERAAGLKLGGGVLQLSHRELGLPGLGECAARERACETRLDGRPDVVRSVGRGERALGGAVGVAGLERDGRGGTISHRRCHSESKGRGRGLRARGCAFGCAAAAKREPAAGQQLEPLGPPDARDERELVAPRRRYEGIGGAPWVAVLEQRGGERHPGCADEALVESARQLDALLGGPSLSTSRETVLTLESLSREGEIGTVMSLMESNGAPGAREAERSVGERSEASAGRVAPAGVPDPELVERPKRRRFSADYKLRGPARG
jgi:hypothetical protein